VIEQFPQATVSVNKTLAPAATVWITLAVISIALPPY
jgi:hypothetical protein